MFVLAAKIGEKLLILRKSYIIISMKQPVDERLIKTVQVIGYLLSLNHSHKMNRVKLMKLLWAADRFHIRKYGRLITETDYYAMCHGPVSSLALDVAQVSNYALSDNDIQYIEQFFMANKEDTSMILSPGEDHLSKSDKEELVRAWETFGSKETFDTADKISHRYPEWSKFKKSFQSGDRRSKPIDIADFFKDPDGEDRFFNEDPEILVTSKEEYHDRQELKDSLGI